MKTDIKTITPKEALKIIEEQDALVASGAIKQRRVNDKLVHQFAADMAAGKWLLTHQGIAFSSGGYLCDGQHRLRAVVRANKPIQFMVSHGVDDIDVLDTGLMRPLYQQLGIAHNYTNAIEHVAIIKGICMFVTYDGVRLSPQQAISIYDKSAMHGKVLELFNLIPVKRLRRQGFTVPWLFFSAMRPNQAREFAVKYHLLENCEAGSPPLVLNRYVQNIGSRPRTTQIQMMNVTAQALQYFHNKQPLPTSSLRGSREARQWLLEGNKEFVKLVLDVLNYPSK